MITITDKITVRPVQQIGGDALIVAAARVSTSGEEALQFVDQAANAGLINYLMKHRHGTPFEHGLLTCFVHVPLFIAREWERHRIQSYNEESGRYKELEPVFWIPRRERAMIPVANFKPARPAFAPATEAQYQLIEENVAVYKLAYQAYKEEIAAGIAREVARRLLPLAIYTSFWTSLNPRAIMHFLSLRTHEPTALFTSYPQAEIEEAARTIEEIFEVYWPLAYRAFVTNGRVAP